MSDEILEIHGTQASLLVLRLKRNQKLSESDWTQTNDIRLENDEEWVAYRSLLRDLPANTEDPTKPEWPEPPQVKKIVPGKTQLNDLEERLANHTHPDLEERITNHTHPDLEERLTNHTHPLEPHTHPLEPLEPHTHSDLVDQLTIEKAKNHDLQQRLTLLEHSHTALVARLEALENM